MSEKEPDSSSEHATQPARPVVVAPPPVARSTRRTPEPIVTATPSTDAFATPSETSKLEPQVLTGAEPAIFGGVNPPSSAPAAQLPAAPAEIPAEQVPEEDEVSAGPVVRPNPRNVLRFIRQSNTVLLVLLTLGLTLGSWVVVESIPAESYVFVTVHMRSASAPSPEEMSLQQAEINNVLRTYPLRAAAKTILTKDAPNLAPGFLDNMMFNGTDAIIWEPAKLTLRVNTTRPAEDGPRLAAAATAFLQTNDLRQRGYAEHAAKLENFRVHARELLREQSELQQDQSKAPGTNPSTDSSFAHTLTQRIETTNADIAREQRILDTWISPGHIDPAGVQSHDNRPLRRNTLIGLCATLLTVFGVPVWLNYASRSRDRRIRRRKLGASITRKVQAK